MSTPHRTRARIEAALAAVTALLLALTAVWPEWIEGLTGLEPDSGSGEAERVVAGALLIATVSLATLARRHWRAPATGER